MRTDIHQYHEQLQVGYSTLCGYRHICQHHAACKAVAKPALTVICMQISGTGVQLVAMPACEQGEVMVQQEYQDRALLDQHERHWSLRPWCADLEHAIASEQDVVVLCLH